ncbi:TIGR03621 family F420-dependent LLM class oxidoreductase [Pseudonocardia sp. NPDC049635]|uniref:TIGR03621 family F420-dependent LLM class oxidoreductase n=1 Tax=Pseudonocardia sp. NPDC049635 TaxID=3155506 RepID=UPI003410D2D4
MVRPFRFGVCLIAEGRSRADFVRTCRRAEDLGYDLVAAADHVNLCSPLPAVMLAAEVTSRVRVGTYVLNASFHEPALLRRDIATLDRFTDGRLEVGLGSGYVPWEFEAVGRPWAPRERVDRLAAALEALTAGPDLAVYRPRQSPRPPLLVGGNGDRVLALAARYAETVGLVGTTFRPELGRMDLLDRDELAGRVKYVHAMAGDRAADLRLDVLAKATVITGDRASAVAGLRRYGRALSDDQLLELPSLWVGSLDAIEEQMYRHREELGISSVTVMEHDLESFGRVIARMR